MTIENFRLTIFRAVAHHLSFSRAAEELLLTQPAVTQQIKALEEGFGVPLFHRGGGRITLTPGGAASCPSPSTSARISSVSGHPRHPRHLLSRRSRR